MIVYAIKTGNCVIRHEYITDCHEEKSKFSMPLLIDDKLNENKTEVSNNRKELFKTE